MIEYEDIANGIADSIAYVFNDAVISDDPYSHIDGDAFIVKAVSYSPMFFSKRHAQRTYHFDIVYFAPMEKPMHEIDAIGQKLLEAFMYPIKFDGRYINAKNLNSVKIDKDFHVEFDLIFFDEIEQREKHDTAQNMELSFTVQCK